MDARTPDSPAQPVLGPPVTQRVLSPGFLAAVIVAAGAVLMFGVQSPWGNLVLLTGVGLGLLASRPLGRDLGVIALGLLIVHTISVEADITWPRFFLMGGVLTAAVVIPYLVHRYQIGRASCRERV